MKKNKLIDHTVLKPETPKQAIIDLCEEAKQHDFASVCINPNWVSTAYEILKDTDVKVCTVIGFPLGASTTATKDFETRDAIMNGAEEIDMVINIGALKSKMYDVVEDDIRAVVKAAQGNTVKVIIETALLTNDEKITACELAVKAQAHFVKTSTGFSTNGATVEDVELMKKAVAGSNLEVKAAGGVRSLDDLEAMVQAGATRIGTSNAISILAGEKATEDTY